MNLLSEEYTSGLEKLTDIMSEIKHLEEQYNKVAASIGMPCISMSIREYLPESQTPSTTQP